MEEFLCVEARIEGREYVQQAQQAQDQDRQLVPNLVPASPFIPPSQENDEVVY